MDAAAFYRLVQEARIAVPEQSIAGTSILLPYGKRLANSIESLILDEYEARGYEEVCLPQIICARTAEQTGHKELFRARNEYNEFFLAPGTEVQAVMLLNTLLESYRNLPIRIYSKCKVYRQGTKVPFIKEVEIRTCEFNAFFERDANVEEEISRLNEFSKTLLDTLHIPYVETKDSPSGPTQHKLYAYFPFSEKFGGLFCFSNIAATITSNFSRGYNTEENELRKPMQLNASYTSRLLFAYLANNHDEHGFIVDPPVHGYDVCISRNEFKLGEADYIAQTLAKAGIIAMIQNGKTEREAYRRFMLTGVPVQVGAGNHEMKIRARDSMVSWIPKEKLIPSIMQLLDKYRQRPPRQKQEISVVHLDTPLKNGEYRTDAAYAVPLTREDTFMRSGLRKLGHIADNNVLFVRRKY